MTDNVFSGSVKREGLEEYSQVTGEHTDFVASKSVTKDVSQREGGSSAVKDETELGDGRSGRPGVVNPSLIGTTLLTLNNGAADCKEGMPINPNAGSGLVEEGKMSTGNSNEFTDRGREGGNGQGQGQGGVGGGLQEGEKNLDVEMGDLNLVGEVLEDGCESLLAQPIARALSCSICHGILLDAYKCLECMHSYCYTCVRSRVEIGDPRNVCPVENCGRHDIDGFTSTCLGPNPFDPAKPKLLPDSLLSGIVKKVFGFGSCPPSPDDTDETDEIDFEKPDMEPLGLGLTDFKDGLAMETPTSLLGDVATDNQNWKYGTPPFVSGPDPGVSVGKVPRKRGVKGVADRKPRKTAPKLRSGASGSQTTPPKGSTSAKSAGRKRSGSKGVSSPTKRSHAATQSLVDLALFPVDALDKSQVLPALQCNYFKMPGTVLVEFLLRFVREELQSPRLVLFCGDRLLMPDAKKSLEWVRKEVWLPRDKHQDIFTLYYSDHTSLPDGHWLRGN